MANGMNRARKILEQVSGLTDAEVRDWADQIQSDLGLAVFDVWLSGNDIKLNTIIVSRGERKQGVGSEALKRLCIFADFHNKRIVLTTAVKDKDIGTTSGSRLKKFYKQFGFVENKNRNKDFTISDNMIRNPKG